MHDQQRIDSRRYDPRMNDPRNHDRSTITPLDDAGIRYAIEPDLTPGPEA